MASHTVEWSSNFCNCVMNLTYVEGVEGEAKAESVIKCEMHKDVPNGIPHVEACKKAGMNRSLALHTLAVLAPDAMISVTSEENGGGVTLRSNSQIDAFYAADGTLQVTIPHIRKDAEASQLIADGLGAMLPAFPVTVNG